MSSWYHQLVAYLEHNTASLQVPILDWLPNYQWKQDFPNDLNAGITVFMLLIPQGMAYAVLAGMPPVYGLYTATIPLIIYATLGTSRQLSLGPFAITSLLLGNTCLQYGYPAESKEYIQLVSTLSMLAGFVSLVMGYLNMGSLVNFLSQSVLTGFITASACVITLSQMKYILGIPTPHFTYSHQTISYLLTHLPQTNPNAVFLGITAIVGLYAAKRWKQANSQNKNPTVCYRIAFMICNIASLIAILLGTLIAYLITIKHASSSNQAHAPIAIVGNVPSGLLAPEFSFPHLHVNDFVRMLPSAFILAIIGFTGNWAVATRYAKINKYECSASQELLAAGYCNILGVFCHGFYSAGGLARSAVNAESGARTPLAGVITAVLIMISLLSLTACFYYIPMALLGAVIIVSVNSMMDFDKMIRAYRIDKRDFIVMFSTFSCTFFLGISQGVGLGVAISMSMVLYGASNVHFATLGRLKHLSTPSSPHRREAAGITSSQYHSNEDTISTPGYIFRDVARFPNAQQLPGIAIVRMDANLFFANAMHFKNVVMAAAAGEYHSNRLVNITLVILDVSAWIDLDLVSLDTLADVQNELLSKNIKIAIVHAMGRIRDQLVTGNFVSEALGKSISYYSIEEAIGVFEVESDVAQMDCNNTQALDTRSQVFMAPCADVDASIESVPLGMNLPSPALYKPVINSNDEHEFVVARNPLVRT